VPARRVRDALLLGGATGLRTFAAPAGLVLRGRLVRNPARFALLAAAAGELVGDKLPATPERTTPPSLGARIASAATVGHAVGGPAGAGLAAAAATTTAYAFMDGRARLGERLGVPDAAIGAAEDTIAMAAVAIGTRRDAGPPAPAPPQHPTPPPDWPPRRRPGALATAARGLVAGLAGTAAMTGSQALHRRLTGAAPSGAPGELGRRALEAALGRRVPRRHRPALDQAVHWLYGSTWGIPFALIARGAPHHGVLSAGSTLGLALWSTSLVELPVLGLAPPVWDQPPEALSADAGFHLVYGLAAAAVLRVLTPPS
jgi:uncharacterized membrane protein